MQSSSSLFEALFKRKPTDPDNVEYLQQLTDKYPFFSPAQFYLLLQKEQSSEDYNKQAAKTSLLLNNPYWLNFKLLNAKQAIIKNNEISITAEPITISENEAVVNEVIHPETEPIKAEITTSDKSENNELLFEPLYTTDYFASQGIKLSEEIQPNDKLGKQLKSFTDWLKTMKKINPDKLQVDLNIQTDAVVQTLAENSNNEDEVLTETMAEVLIQQGKTEKAMEVYQKLSLLNPSKNIYFAAKIEQLKAH